MDLSTIDPTSEETEEATAEVVEHLQHSYRQDDVKKADDVKTADDAMKANVTSERARRVALTESLQTPDIYPGVWRQFSVLFR